MKKLFLLFSLICSLMVSTAAFAEEYEVANVGDVLTVNSSLFPPNVNYSIEVSDPNVARILPGDKVQFYNIGDVVLTYCFSYENQKATVNKHFRVVGALPNNAFSLSPNANQAMTDEEYKRIMAEEVVRLVNIERAKIGVRPLRLNEELYRACAIRAKEITREFSHTRPDGRDCLTVLDGVKHSSYGYTRGENIAAGNETPEAVVNQWMNSPGHRANILNRNFSEIGVGYEENANTKYVHYWVQLFQG